MNNEDTRREYSAGSTRVLSDSELQKQMAELQKQVADFAAQRLAISAVLRTIANSPHDLQPIFDTIIDSAIHLCRADGGILRIVEEAGFRLVANKLSPLLLAEYAPPMLYEHGGFVGRRLASKSPVHIPDFAAEIRRAGEVDRALAPLSKVGVGTVLFVPMLRNDELIGSLNIARLHIEPFTEKEIELVTDFATEASIALGITSRERQLRELQMQLAHTNRIVTMGELSASITHEVNQPIAAARNNVIAALHFLDRNPPDLPEVREALAAAVKDADRVGAIVGRMRALMQKASPRLDRVDMNEALQDVIELTRGEALKNGVSVETQLAKGLPIIAGDRVQLQQVVLNLILNALQAMGAVSEGATKPNGMGMGLTICRSIIETHGGRLWATACQPHGALFQFAIPARP